MEALGWLLNNATVSGDEAMADWHMELCQEGAIFDQTCILERLRLVPTVSLERVSTLDTIVDTENLASIAWICREDPVRPLSEMCTAMAWNGSLRT